MRLHAMIHRQRTLNADAETWNVCRKNSNVAHLSSLRFLGTSIHPPTATHSFCLAPLSRACRSHSLIPSFAIHRRGVNTAAGIRPPSARHCRQARVDGGVDIAPHSRRYAPYLIMISYPTRSILIVGLEGYEFIIETRSCKYISKYPSLCSTHLTHPSVRQK